MSQYQVNLCSHVRTIKHLSHCVRVLDRLSHIVDQMECTPVLYARCLREIVCRRETFEAFAEWKLQSLPNVALVEMQQLQAELANHFLVLLFGSIVKGSTTERTAFHEFFDSNCNLPAVSRADLHDLLLRVPTLKEHLLLLPSERAFFESLAEELCVELPGDAPPTPAWTNDSFHSTREHLSTSQQGGVLPKVCCDASVSVESPGLLMSAEKLNILLQQTQTLHHWVQHSLPSLRQCQTQLKEEFSRTISIQIDQCRQFEDEIMKQLLHFSPAPERPLPPEMSHKAVNTPNSHLNAAHIQQLQQRKHNLQSTVESCRHDSDEAVASLRNQHHAVLTQLTQSLQENHQQALSELRHQLESQHDQDRKFLTENMQNTVQQKINDLQRTIDALMEQNMSLRQLVQEQQVDCTKEREYIGKLKSTTSQLSEKLPKTSAKQFAPVEALSRVIKFVHHDFKSGDLVAFTPVACSSGEQWRMLSSDGKVYFLLEECFAYLTHIIQAGGSTKSIQPVQQQLSQRPDLVKLAIFATKEKCQSKKDSNRYDVPSDSHFYRVIIHPRAIGSSSTS